MADGDQQRRLPGIDRTGARRRTDKYHLTCSEHNHFCLPPTMAAELDGTAVVVAVSGARSRRAIRWAAVNLIPHASCVYLVHVVPPLYADHCKRQELSLVLPFLVYSILVHSRLRFLVVTELWFQAGENTPAEQAPSGSIQLYRDVRLIQIRRILLPFKRLCETTGKVEIVVLVGEDPAIEILRYMSGAGLKNLVLGASTFSWISRFTKGTDVPSTILRSSPDSWNVFLVSRWKLVFKLACQNLEWDADPAEQIRKDKLRMFTQKERSLIFDERMSRHRSMPSNIDESCTWSHMMPSNVNNNTMQVSIRSDLSRLDSHASTDSDDSAKYCQNSVPTSVMPAVGQEQTQSTVNQTWLSPRRALSLDVIPFSENTTLESDDLEEVKKLKMELQNTLAKYDRACKDLISTKKKAEVISAEYSEEAKKVKIAREKEEILRQVAAKEKAKRMEVIREIDEAKQLLAQAAIDRHKAEISALQMSSDRLRLVEAFFSSDKACRRYSSDEIISSTDNFSDAKKIGNGAFGNIYRGILDHTPVAIKVLHEDALEKEDQFIREVEVLTQLRHPNMVLLLGVCPEMRCLVYEYMEKGSLEDHISFKDGMQPLPWHARFRIIFEVACGLAFLHGSKPDPIVHCDLKPGNILLDQNYTSKISDVGLARFMTEVVSDSVTEYRETLIAGTACYMDPEYQRTGILRPKSDLYAFGIVVLQLLTARRPLRILAAVEDAIKNGSFGDLLDASVKGWPLAEAEKLAQLALRCSSLRCRDRPDLETEVLPEIEKILEVFDVQRKLNKFYASAPNHYFCPILKEVMEDPYIASDGFSYEYKAIKSWLAKHDTSPVTGLKLEHAEIIPNLTLHSGILEWRSQMEL